jgi:hypothetical protein
VTNILKIAERMQAQARLWPDPAEPQVEAMWQHLSRGLSLLLVTRGNVWRLVMTRRDVMPSPVEERVIRDAFQVPTDATRIVVPRAHMIQFSWPLDLG